MTSSLLNEFNELSRMRIFRSIQLERWFQEHEKSNFMLRNYHRELILRLNYYLFTYPQNKQQSHLMLAMGFSCGKTFAAMLCAKFLFEKGYEKIVFVAAEEYDLQNARQMADSMKLYGEGILEFRKAHLLDFNQGDSIQPKTVFLLKDTFEENTKSNLGEQICAHIASATVIEFSSHFSFFQAHTIPESYTNKLIFRYTLKSLRKDGFTKNVKISSCDSAYSALISGLFASVFRAFVANQSGLAFLPTVLVKCASPKQAEKYYLLWRKMMKELSNKDISHLGRKNRKSTITEVLRLMRKYKVNADKFLRLMQQHFHHDSGYVLTNPSKIRMTASLLLQKKTYSIIFTTNLFDDYWKSSTFFDVVRLDASRKFGGNWKSDLYSLMGCIDGCLPVRLCDHDPHNHLKWCESMNYHHHFGNDKTKMMYKELRQVGLIAEFDEPLQFEFIPAERQKNIISISKKGEKLIHYPSICYQIEQKGTYFSVRETDDSKENTFLLSEIGGMQLCKRVMSDIPFYFLQNLKGIYPELKSFEQFIDSPIYAGKVKIILPSTIQKNEDNLFNIPTLHHIRPENLSKEAKIHILKIVLEKLIYKII